MVRLPGRQGWSRRHLLRTGTASVMGVAGLSLLWGSSGTAAGNAGTVRGPQSRRTVLRTDWRFGGRHTDEAAVRPDFDDSRYATVAIPHTVTELSWRDWEPESWEHVWIYRRHFNLPDGYAGSRVFLDFDGVLTSATPWLNGTRLPEHSGGYLPFSHEVTDLVTAEDNLVAVTVDSRWLPVPPSGHPGGTGEVDFFQPGGIYRDVTVRAVPATFLADLYARPVDVLADRRHVEVEVTVDTSEAYSGDVTVELRDRDGRVVARDTTDAVADGPGTGTVTATLRDLGEVRLWDLDDPYLYQVVAVLHSGGEPVHQYATRIGFREARFDTDGFHLNGRRVKLFGVNRHQIYPYAGMAMPDRVQAADARILKQELNCSMVRCAHYPQSPAFLDACDELGLLVFEEIPGWQYVGDAAWQDLVVRDVEAMIRRDRNRPSIVVWGTRVNESANYPELYPRTRELAKRLDPSRQTTGAMLASRYSTVDFDADVFSYNDYTHSDEVATLRPPLPGIPFLVSEAVGSLAGPHFYRRTDPQDIQARQAYLHAQVHNQAGSDDRYAGLLAWQAFDYDSMTGFTDHRLKCNGVADTFRVPKLGAAIYAAQVDPRTRPVIAPAFHWDFGPDSPDDGPGPEAMICSNCDRLEIFVGGRHRGTARPDVEGFGYLAYPPSFVDLMVDAATQREHPDLRIDGYVGDHMVASRHFSSDPSGDRLSVVADDDTLTADGSDATRVVFRAVDRYGAPRPYVNGDVDLDLALSGPADLVGEQRFAFGDNGGVGAVWVRTRAGDTGEITLTASHSELGTRSVTIRAEA